jgi:cytoskeleton protein RodZ
MSMPLLPANVLPATALPAIALPAAAVPPLPAPDNSRVILRARADSWVQVRDKQGTVLINRVLRKGESWSVPAGKPQLLLTTGNAGGTDLVVDGATLPSLGAPGAVRRDMPLDPDQLSLKSGATPAPGSTSRPGTQ